MVGKILKRDHTGFACCVFNNNHNQQVNQTILLPKTSPKCHLMARRLRLGECQTVQGFRIVLLVRRKMRSNCTSSHYDFFPLPLHFFFFFFVPLGLHTVKEHQNKQRRSRGNERLQCFGNTGVLTTHAVPCQLAGVKGDRWVDRRVG